MNNRQAHAEMRLKIAKLMVEHTNANKEIELNKTFRKIDQFFHERKAEKFIPLLKIINFLEVVTYDYIASIDSKKKRKIFDKVYEYCFENFTTRFTSVKANNPSDFVKHISNYRRHLPVGGVILVNKKKEFLCVVNKHDDVNFPMGKQDYADERSLKITALRELGEEAGIWLSEEEFEKVGKYIEYRLYYGGKLKRFHFYIIEGFNKKVDLNHSRRGEIARLVWMKPQQVMQMGNNTKISKNELLHDSDEKGAFSISWFIRKIILKSETQHNPFRTFGKKENCKAEVYNDVCIKKEPYFANRNYKLSKI